MKTLLKWVGIIVTGLVCLALLGVAWIYSASNRAMNRRYLVGAAWLTVPGDSATLARGDHLVHAVVQCVGCHGDDLGGMTFIDNPAFGRVTAPNITAGQGGVGARYTDQELARVIQHGVKRDGRPVLIMPADAYINLADDDLAAIIAFLRHVPPVNRTQPPPALGPVARMLIAAGVPFFPAATLDHDRRTVIPRPDNDTSAAYGGYLVRVAGCASCHNASLSGGKTGDPSSPPAANLTPTGIGEWTEADFVRVLRAGTKIGGAPVDEHMPWKTLRGMTDREIHAIWLYLRTLPPKEFGQL